MPNVDTDGKSVATDRRCTASKGWSSELRRRPNGTCLLTRVHPVLAPANPVHTADTSTCSPSARTPVQQNHICQHSEAWRKAY